MKCRLYIIMLMVMMGLPMAAQHNTTKGKAKNEKFTPAKKGMPAYYEQNARRLYKEGKWEEGRVFVEEGLDKYSWLSSLNELYGQYWLHHKQYDKARFYLIRSFKDDKDNLQSKELLMKIEEITKHYSSAIVYCNELLEASPYNYRLWCKKIELYRLNGNETEASRLLARLLEIYPDRAEVRKQVEDDLENKYRKYHKKGNLAGQEETLRKLVGLMPENSEFQMALCNLLLKTGRYEEALDVAGHAATLVSSPYPFVEKKAGILAGMARYSEAISYAHDAQANIKALAISRGKVSSLIDELETEAARAAAKSDPYTAYARIFERTHSEEALTYLLNTSMSRGYLDDALMYIREARRRRGDTENLLYREYTVQRRLGNMRAATNVLERIHNLWPNSHDANEELCAIKLEDVRKMMDLEQWTEAATVLEGLSTYKVDSETMYAIKRRLFTCYVKAGLRQKALAQLDKLNETKEKTAELYEEVMMPYIKQLIAQGRLQQADAEIQKVLDYGQASADILQIAISVAMKRNDADKAVSLVLKGKSLYPDDPFFLLKDAQLTAAAGDYAKAYDMLHDMIDEYSGDSAVIGAYADCCETLALSYAKASGYEAALRLIDEALAYYPDNQELILTKSQILEKQKEWEKAIETYKQYKPTIGELREYNLRMESLKRHLMTNQVFMDYQRARPSGEDKITSQATIAYTKFAKRNTYTVGMIYAGRDGTSKVVTADDAEGGSGVHLNGEWLHEWTDRLTTTLAAGWANKFLPRIKVDAAAEYETRNDWTAKGSVTYRLIGTNGKTSLVGAGVGATIDMAPFSIGTNLNVFSMFGENTQYLASRLSMNGSVTAKCFPVENNRSNIFVSGSVGNAPELSLIDISMPVKFNQLNTMLGFGGLYVANSMIDLGLSGSWFTLSVAPASSEKGSNTKNYLYINANVTIHF